MKSLGRDGQVVEKVPVLGNRGDSSRVGTPPELVPEESWSVVTRKERKVWGLTRIVAFDHFSP